MTKNCKNITTVPMKISCLLAKVVFPEKVFFSLVFEIIQHHFATKGSIIGGAIASGLRPGTRGP